MDKQALEQKKTELFSRYSPEELAEKLVLAQEKAGPDAEHTSEQEAPKPTSPPTTPSPQQPLPSPHQQPKPDEDDDEDAATAKHKQSRWR